MHPALLALIPLIPLPGGSPWQGGYGRDLHGEVISYSSALPEVGSALLVRSIDAGDFIEWETRPAPEQLDGDRVSFVWLFGLDANPERREFELQLDGAPLLRFRNPATALLEAWEVAAESGARLQFRPTRIDRHDDLFGFAVLSLPAARVKAGQPLRLKVVGESAGSRVWFMTFRASPEAGAKVSARNALLRGEDGGAPWQPVALELVHLGAPTSARIQTSWGVERAVELKLGANRFELPHPEVPAATDETVSLRAEDGTAYQLDCRVTPVRPWTVFLVQHTHTDLGYTRPQTEILPDHLRYIDYALDYCDLTDDYPDDARFRWTCEASWPVREWLRYRPEAQIERLRRRVAEGRIELTAMFANLSELLDERGCAASLEPLRELRRHGLPVVSAMQDDVNGIAWSYADLLPELGVRYLNMGEHGHRALIPFDVPTAFWWESRSGSRLLAWRPDHYNTGNFWGIHTGRMETVEPALFRYLEGLEQRGYPMDRVAVQYSGVFLDNAPPGIVANGFIRDWNERFAWPRLRSATVSELPRILERERGAELPVWRAAWPDWWSDGVGSAPREAAAARRTQDELTAVEGLLAMAALLDREVPAQLEQRVARAREQLVIYGEHTYGAAESVRDPGAENSKVQWAQKSAFVWDAVKETAILKEAAFGLLQGGWPRSDAPTITIVNTLGWPRSGLARAFIDKELLPPGRAFRLLDHRGREAPAQLWQARHDGNWWALQVEDVPAFGWRSYRLELLDGPAPAPPAAGADGVLENSHYRLQVDLARGGLVSLYDKQLGRELVDADADWGFGQLVHEQLGNRWQIERFRLDDFERTGLVPARLEAGVHGPLWRSLFLRGAAAICPGENGLEIEVRLYQLEKKLEFRYRLRKRPETAPEGLYAAFPFDLPHSKLAYEITGGAVDPETDLLPRTSSDWQAAQRFVALANAEARVTLSSPETLLWHFGGLNLGRFQDRAKVEQPHVYAWLLNNYWVTNFLASQDGELFWSQAITSGPAGDAAAGSGSAASTRFGWNHQMPLLARVLPPGRQAAPLPPPRSLLGFAGAEVVLIGARQAPAGGLLLQLRETTGQGGRIQVSGPDGQPLQTAFADVLGRPLGAASASNAVRPFQSFHLLVPGRSSAAPAQIFVAPGRDGGDDSGPGSYLEPYATPGRALRAVRALRASDPERGVTVLLRGGVYSLEAPLVMGADAGGGKSASVLWSSFPGERAVFSGGRVMEVLPGEEGELRRIPGFDPGSGQPSSVFLDGVCLPRARHPNSGWLRVDQAGSDRRTSFTFEAGAAPEIVDPAGLEVLLLHDWSTSRVPVAEFDASGGWLRTGAPIGCAAPHYAIDNFEPHPRFLLEGHRDLIDSPGEWAVDASSGTLWLADTRGLAEGLPALGDPDARLEVPVLDRLLRIEGSAERPVRNLHFQGIDFELCAFIPPADGWAGAQASMHERRDGSERQAQRIFVPAAVNLEYAVACSFSGSGFRQLDGSAVWIGAGCRDVALRDCEISDIGANGVNIGEDGARQRNGQPWWKGLAADAPEITRNIVLERNLIERCGQLYGGAVGVWIGFAADCVIRRNDIRELPYTGLSVGWVWAPDPSPCRGHLIERNDIHEVMQLLSDGGCIYTLGRQPGTVIRENHLHGVPRHAGRAPSNGIFVDEGSTEILIVGNWIHDIGHSPIRFHRAGENTIAGNLLEAPEGVPTYYYNRTEPERIEKIGNQVGDEIDPAARARVAARAGRGGSADGAAFGLPFNR